jgi:integrase
MNLENTAYFERFEQDFKGVPSTTRNIMSAMKRYIKWLEERSLILPDVTQEQASEFVRETKVETSVLAVNMFYRWLHEKFPDKPLIKVSYKMEGINFKSRYDNIPCRREVLLIAILPKMIPHKRKRLATSCMVSLMINEGLRPDEIADLDRGSLNKSTLVLSVLNSKGVRRDIPLTNPTSRKLKNYMKHFPDSPEEPMFKFEQDKKSVMGKRITGVTIAHRIINKFNKLTQTGAPPITTLNIRQSAAMRMLAEGYPVREVSYRIGVAKTTIENLKRYAKFREDNSLRQYYLLTKHAKHVHIEENGRAFVVWRNSRYSARHLARIKKKKLETFKLGGENGLSYTMEW